MPIVLSRNQGGISRLLTRSLIARAQGRASEYVRRDIGAISSGRWHRTHERFMIGATSFVNVTARSERADAVCADPTTGCNANPTTNAGTTHLPEPKQPATFIVILL